MLCLPLGPEELCTVAPHRPPPQKKPILPGCRGGVPTLSTRPVPGRKEAGEEGRPGGICWLVGQRKYFAF